MPADQPYRRSRFECCQQLFDADRFHSWTSWLDIVPRCTRRYSQTAAVRDLWSMRIAARYGDDATR